MEPEPATPSVESNDKFESLKKVTPLSKYLAMALFIILPFIGGWIGYTYAPEKVMEQEKNPPVIGVNTSIKSFSEEDIAGGGGVSGLILGDEVAFVSYNSDGWSGAWMLKKSDSGSWLKQQYMNGLYIVSDGVVIGDAVFLNVSGAYADGERTWSGTEGISIYNFKTNSLIHVKLPEIRYITNIIGFGDKIIAYGLSGSYCPERPVTEEDFDCQGQMIAIDLDGSYKLLVTDLPPAKELVAYDPEKKEVVLRDGYGDGCVFSNYYTYSVDEKSFTDKTHIEGCFEYEPDHEYSYESYKKQVSEYERLISENYKYTAIGAPYQIVSHAGDGIAPVREKLAYPETGEIADLLFK